MATSPHPELIDLVGQGSDRGGVGATVVSGITNGTGGGVGGMRAGVATATGAGMGSGVPVRMTNGTQYGVRGGNANGMGTGVRSGFGGPTQSRFGGATGGGSAGGIGDGSASEMRVGVARDRHVCCHGYRMSAGAGISSGGGGLFEELRGFDLRSFSNIGGPVPEATKQVRQQYRDLGNMMHDLNERNLEYLEARVNEQEDMLQRYQQRLQDERNEAGHQRYEYEASANEKILALQKQLDNETKVTGNLKTEIEALRSSNRFHLNINQNQSDIIEERERELSAMRNAMATEKKAAEKKVKELLEENVRLKLKVGHPSGNTGQEILATGQNESGDSVASGSGAPRTPRTRRGTRTNGGIGAIRARGSGLGSSRRSGRNTARVAINSADPVIEMPAALDNPGRASQGA